MSSAPPELRADWRRPTVRQRALVIALTLIAELIFLLVLLGLGPTTWTGREPSEPTLVDLINAPPASAPAPASAKSVEARAKPPVPRPPTLALPPSPLAKSPFVKLTREEYAAADISKLGSAGGQGRSSGETSASAGTGPGGATLYKAEWYREPTDAELAYYLPKSVPPGSWAQVACKTIPDNRVENCQALGESPPGSGLGKALRLAGWQFRIRPPRIDGKPQVGTWVRVHIDFTR